MDENVTRENELKAQREYMRAWRKQNKDRVREYNRAYWAKAAKRAEQKRKEEGNGRTESEN